MKRSQLVVSAAALLASAGVQVVRAQCAPQWFPTAGVSGGTGVNADALTVWDPDGAGPQAPVLAVGGSFTTAGGVPANNIATWNGTAFAPLGLGIDGQVDAVAVLPDGRLAAAGLFSTAGGVPVGNVAAWNGSVWSALGTGFNNQVWTLSTNSITGELFAGGMFTTADGLSANRVARWTGNGWASLGTGTANGVGNIVYALTPLANGDMVVGGAFLAAGGVANRRSVARWATNGTWNSMAAGMNAAVLSLGTMSDGTSVVAGGIFTFADVGAASRIAMWDGTHWLPMGAGTNAQPLVFLPLPNGQLIAGGHFMFAGTVAASKVAFWDGGAWSAMGIGMDAYVIGLAQMPGGDVFAGGGFTTVDGVASPCLARWASPTPKLGTQPTDTRTCAAGPATLSVIATGSGPLAYQWQIESPAGMGTFVNLTGATFDEPSSGLSFRVDAGSSGTDTLRVSGIALGNHGSVIRMRCEVTNACGTVASDAADILVCYANCDCSTGAPSLTGNDFQCFLDKFVAADTYADCDGVGGLTANDFQCFINAFVAGCS